MTIRSSTAPGEIRQAINASLNKVDQNKVAVDQAMRLLASKLDVRNTVEHTFAGTSEESMEHGLGRVPIGSIIIYQSKAATILGDESKWTKNRIYLVSSAAGNKVRLLLL
jgi:hypothetical protein